MNLALLATISEGDQRLIALACILGVFLCFCMVAQYYWLGSKYPELSKGKKIFLSTVGYILAMIIGTAFIRALVSHKKK